MTSVEPSPAVVAEPWYPTPDSPTSKSSGTLFPPHKPCRSTGDCKLEPSGDVCHTDLTQFYKSLELLNKRQVITLEEVQSNSNNTPLCDSLDGLNLYCYHHSLDIQNLDELTQECRGVVFDANGKLVSRAFGYTPIYELPYRGSFPPKDARKLPGDWQSRPELPDDVCDYLQENFKACKFYPALEGALVRAFYYGDKWYLTTHRKLDAFKSFWGCRTSFGQLFLDGLTFISGMHPDMFPNKETLLQDFFATLDKERQYVFLVVNTEKNRIVCIPPRFPLLLHVGTFKDGVLFDDPSENLCIGKQQPLEFETLQELYNFVHVTNPYHYQGVVAFLPNGKQVKLCSYQYLDLFHLRGNESSVMFRYLSLRKTSYEEAFRSLYPEYNERFNNYEKAIVDVAEYILQAYVSRFIKKEYVVLPKDEYEVMSAAHRCYKNQDFTEARRKVSVSDILFQIDQMSPTSINHMIRRYKEYNKKKQVVVSQ